MTDMFSIERNSLIVGEAHGFFCGKDYPSTIQLVQNADIKDGDWLIHTATKKRYYAVDARPITVNGEIQDWMVKYESELEHQSNQKHKSSASIHIGTVSGPAIIGNQQNATLNVGSSLEDIAKLIANKPTADLPELCELVSSLKKIEESGKPIEKGQLSKFSDILKKHSDILIALGGWAVKLLTGN